MKTYNVGLPVAGKNRDRWEIIRPLLGRDDLRPGPAEIARTVTHMREVLRIRKSTALFRLPTGAAVKARVKFWNTGPQEIPGVIVMSVSDEMAGEPDLDPSLRSLAVVINAGAAPLAFQHDAFRERRFTLHPVQATSGDAVVRQAAYEADGTFRVPARTAAVFVEAD